MMRHYKLRQRVRDVLQPPLLIAPMTLAEPALVEIIGFAGGEAVLIDLEHGMINDETMRSMLVHARAACVAPVYRPRAFDPAACRQALDQGAAGIHVSHVDSAEEAQAVVKACRYAPLGKRDMSLGRAVEYNRENTPRYLQQSNDEILMVVMIESVEALKNVEEIAAIPGIDVLHIGTSDLSHSMGRPRNDIGDALERVLNAAHKHDVLVGYPTDDADKIEQLANRGVRYFEIFSPDYLLRELYTKRISEIQQRLKK